MPTEEASPLVIDLARGFISLVMASEPGWSKAYLRFLVQDAETELKASVVSGSGARIIDVLRHKEFFHSAAAKGQELLQALGKEEGLFLLVVDASFDYEIRFEYEAMDRWKISKLDGGTGIPAGLD